MNGCGKLPYFGPANSIALRCHNHSISGDVNVRCKLKVTKKVSPLRDINDLLAASKKLYRGVQKGCLGNSLR